MSFGCGYCKQGDLKGGELLHIESSNTVILKNILIFLENHNAKGVNYNVGYLVAIRINKVNLTIIEWSQRVVDYYPCLLAFSLKIRPYLLDKDLFYFISKFRIIN